MSKDLDSNVPVGHFMDSADAEIARLTAALAEAEGVARLLERRDAQLNELRATLTLREQQLAQVREAFRAMRTTLYGLALDARQAQLAQKAIDGMADVLTTPARLLTDPSPTP